MGFWSSLGSCISHACSAICSVVSGAFRVAAFAVNVVSAGIAICRALGIFKQDTNSEELGIRLYRRMMPASGLKIMKGALKNTARKLRTLSLILKRANRLM